MKSNSKAAVVAIDGPSGSGKSTIAKLVAEELSLTYLDTGAMFRAIALSLNLANVDLSNESEVSIFLKEMKFEYGIGDRLVQINDEDLSLAIRDHAVSQMASQVSQISEIRTFLKKAQRDIAKVRPSILEGRDIGTIIFPDAALKFFLTADPKVRAKRRFQELKERGTLNGLSEVKILEDIEKRDLDDRTRDIAPLVKAQDAIEVDTTSLSITEVVGVILEHFKENKQSFQL